MTAPQRNPEKLVLGCSVGTAGKPYTRNGLLSDDREDKHWESGRAGYGQAEMKLDMYVECLHPGLVGSGLWAKFLTNKGLHPDLLIIKISKF